MIKDEHLRVLTVDEFDELYPKYKDELLATEEYWLCWKDPENESASLAYHTTRSQSKWNSPKKPGLATARCFVRPVLTANKEVFTPGDMYTIGTDLFKLPLRWQAIKADMLMCCECPTVYQLSSIGFSDEPNDPFEVTNVYHFLNNEFAPSAFTPLEWSAIRKGDFFEYLKPYTGEIEISPSVTEVPEERYHSDTALIKLHILPRTQPLKICKNAFSYSDLQEVTGMEYISEIKARAFYMANICGSLTFGDVRIGGKAFEKNNIETLSFDGTVSSVQAHAFSQNQISDIVCNGAILELGQAAFSGNHIQQNVAEKVLNSVFLAYCDDAFDDQDI